MTTTASSSLQTFDFKENPVRALERDGQPWFVASDVCRVLEIANPRDAVAALATDEKDRVGITDAIGREQLTNCINESGLYALIFKSRKPQAQAFRKWVTSEVLPSLRKTGHFSTGAPAPRGGVSLDFERFPACRDFFEIFFCLRDQQVDPNESCSAALRLLHLNLRKRKSLPGPPRAGSFEAETTSLAILFNTTACEKMTPKMSFSELANVALTFGYFKDIITTQNGELTPASKSSFGLLLNRHHGEEFSLLRGIYRFEVSGQGRNRWYHLIPVA